MYALITGASSGIGKALSYLYANKGYNLIIVARREDSLNEIKKELSNKVEVIVKSFDLSILDNCYKLFDEVKELDIDIFINNAGYGNVGMYFNTNLDVELNMVKLNIDALQVLTKLFIKNYDKGTVVNVGSMAGQLPTPRLAVYAGTKAFVNSFSRAINYELKRNNKNVRVLTVAPGPVKTEFSKVANASINRGMSAIKCAEIIAKGIEKNKEFIIPGFTMKLAYIFSKILPTKLLLKAAYKIQKRK